MLKQLFELYSYRFKYSDLSRKIFSWSSLLSIGYLVKIKKLKLKTAIFSFLFFELGWRFYIQNYVLPKDLNQSRTFDNVTKDDKEKFLKEINEIKKIINNNPEKYWKQIAYPLELNSINSSTVKDVIKCLSRDRFYAFINKQLINKCYNIFQKSSGVKFKNGIIQKHHLRNWFYDDNLNISPIWHSQLLMLDFIDFISDCQLFWNGWQNINTENVKISARFLKKSKNLDETIVIFPGLTGHQYYLNTLIKRIIDKYPSKNLLLFEIPFIELKDTISLISWSELIESILILLKKININQFDIIAHSYGTLITNRFIRYIKKIYPYNKLKNSNNINIKNIFLIEPVIFQNTSSGISPSFISNKVNFKSFITIANSQGLPWIETINYNIDDLKVYIYLSLNDNLVWQDYTIENAKRWIKNVNIFYNNPGKHGEWNIPFISSSAKKAFSNVFNQISL